MDEKTYHDALYNTNTSTWIGKYVRLHEKHGYEKTVAAIVKYGTFHEFKTYEKSFYIGWSMISDMVAYGRSEWITHILSLPRGYDAMDRWTTEDAFGLIYLMDRGLLHVPLSVRSKLNDFLDTRLELIEPYFTHFPFWAIIRCYLS